MPEKVTIVDVTPRDGLQNEPKFVSTENKLQLIEKLVGAGISHIQATSFVSPSGYRKWPMPRRLPPNCRASVARPFPALVPNLKGYDRAVAAGLRHLEFVMSASESFNRKNLNRSMAESLELLRETSRKAEADGVTLRVDLSTCFHCPFEGRISSRAVADAVRAIREIAPWRVTICDTDGMAFPDQVRETTNLLLREVKLNPTDLILHVHDTYGRGLANTLAGLDAGIREFDSCTAGLGGCPYSREPAATSPPRIWSTFSKAWALTPAWTWKSCSMPPSSPHNSLPGRIRDISSARVGRAPVK